MGEVAEHVGRFVTAYSSDLRDESLDGQRVVVGGIVTGVRVVITKAKSTMAIVTLEDLQGTIEVVVFPRLYEQTMGTWRDGEILLVAGRVDHKSEEVSLLADLALEWDAAAAAGRGELRPAGGRRGSWRWRPAAGGPTAPGGWGHGNGRDPARSHRWPAPWSRSVPGSRSGSRPAPSPASDRRERGPRRPRDPVRLAAPGRRRPDRGHDRRDVAPADRAGRTRVGLPGYARASPQGPDQDDEPSVPDEARARIVADATADAPVDAGPRHDPPRAVRRQRRAGSRGRRDADVQGVLRDRPGATRVVIHVPAPGGGAALPMELRRGVAYDAELLAEVRRRLGDGLVDLRLASA